MAEILHGLGFWLWPLAAVGLIGLAMWILAIRAIFRSPKFLRKWLWVVLTFLGFGFSWRVGPHATVGIGLPVGALYVLGFARWGMEPTAEEIARHATASAGAPADPRKVLMLRVAYLAFAAALVVQLGWALFGPLLPAMTGQMAAGGAGLRDFVFWLRIGTGVFGLACTAGVVLLAFRPYPLAKLLCGLAGLAWIGHALMSLAIMPMILGSAFPVGLHAAVIGGCGIVAAACGVTHQLVDPRLSGPYLRAR
jgi:hypothetical protein